MNKEFQSTTKTPLPCINCLTLPTCIPRINNFKHERELHAFLDENCHAAKNSIGINVKSNGKNQYVVTAWGVNELYAFFDKYKWNL